MRCRLCRYSSVQPTLQNIITEFAEVPFFHIEVPLLFLSIVCCDHQQLQVMYDSSESHHFLSWDWWCVQQLCIPCNAWNHYDVARTSSFVKVWTKIAATVATLTHLLQFLLILSNHFEFWPWLIVDKITMSKRVRLVWYAILSNQFEFWPWLIVEKIIMSKRVRLVWFANMVGISFLMWDRNREWSVFGKTEVVSVSWSVCMNCLHW